MIGQSQKSDEWLVNLGKLSIVTLQITDANKAQRNLHLSLFALFGGRII
jgi:hypothetical protein